MPIKYPFGYKNVNEVIKNNMSFSGGFYPIGENNMFHGGIHLTGVKDTLFDRINANNEQFLPITPLFDGEVVAMRITKESFVKKILAKLSLKEVETYKKYFDEENIKFIWETIGSSYQKKEEDIYYKLKEGLSDKEKQTIANAMKLKYSNNFILMKHETQTPKGNKIVFYTLYMHIKPYGEIKDHGKYKLFYFDKTYTVNTEEHYFGLKLFNDGKLSKADFVIPKGAYVEKNSNKIYGGIVEEIIDAVTKDKYVCVKSRFLQSRDKLGFINISKCKIINSEEKYYTKEKLEIKHNKTDEVIGNVYKGVQIKYIQTGQRGFIGDTPIFMSFKLDYDKKDKQKITNFEQKLEKKGYIKFTKSLNEIGVAQNKKVIKLTRELKLYENVLTINKTSKKSEQSWNEKKEKLYEGDYIYLEEDKFIEDKVNKVKYQSVKYTVFNEVEGRIFVSISPGKLDDWRLRVEPLVYQVNNNQTKTIGNYESSIKDKGLNVYNGGGNADNDEVIDILKKGSQIHFLDEKSFIDSPGNPQKLDSKYYSNYNNAYIYPGNSVDSNGVYIGKRIDIKYQLNKDVKDGSVTVFSKPKKVSTSTILGYPGSFIGLGQENIAHIELFSENVDFMEPKDKEEKVVYKIKTGFKDFKKIKAVETESESIDIPTGYLLKQIKDNGSNAEFEVISGEPATVWLYYDDVNKNMPWNNTVNRYVAKDNKENLKCYISCPTEDNKEPETVDIKLIKGEYFKWISGSDGVANALNSKLKITYGAYRQLELRKMPDESLKNKKGVLFKKNTVIDGNNYACKIEKLFTVKTDTYFKTTNLIDVWYKDNPDRYEFTEDVEFIGFNEDKILSSDGEIKDKDNKVWIKFNLDVGIEGWVQKDSLPGDVTKIDYMKWKDFFKKYDQDKIKDNVHDMKDVLEELKGDGVKLEEMIQILKDKNLCTFGDNVVKKLLENFPDLYNNFAKMVIVHGSEWKKKDDEFYNKLKDWPYLITKEDEKKEIKEFLEKLFFWDDAKDKLPKDPSKLYYFHPAKFIEHLDKVTDVDVMAIMNNCKVIGDNVQVKVGNKTVLFLNADNEQVQYAAYKNAMLVLRNGSEIGKNLIKSLSNVFRFFIDPELDYIKSFTISSTYRPATDGDSSHSNGYSIDLTGDYFKYNNDVVKYDKDKALKQANLLGKYGAKTILFNCPYVIDKSSSHVAGNVINHHHHFHVQFNSIYGSRGYDYHCYRTGYYKCISHNCGYAGCKI